MDAPPQSILTRYAEQQKKPRLVRGFLYLKLVAILSQSETNQQNNEHRAYNLPMILIFPISRITVLLSICMLAACTPKSEAPKVAEPGDESPHSDQIDTPDTKTPLDLSIPENFFADDPAIPIEASAADFDAGALFDKKDDKAVKITVLPNLKEGATPQKLPQLDGGTVSVEAKTR